MASDWNGRRYRPVTEARIREVKDDGLTQR